MFNKDLRFYVTYGVVSTLIKFTVVAGALIYMGFTLEDQRAFLCWGLALSALIIAAALSARKWIPEFLRGKRTK